MIWSVSEDTVKSLIEYALNADKSPKLAHITRVSMYKHLKDALIKEDHRNSRALCVSHSSRLAELVGLRNIEKIEANYPEANILSLPYKDNEFDFCLSDQVLEHVEGSPLEAFAESVRVIKPSGYVVHTTCFINPRHGAPNDFWRFTEAALALMATKSGCEIVKLGGWGNRAAWGYINLGFRFRAIPNNSANPIYRLATHNEEDVPIVTWIIGRKLAR